MNLDLAISVDDYLTDNEISPKPIGDLTAQPNIYFKQLIECVRHWDAETRLAVGSMIAGQPLKAEGATSVDFVLSANPDKEFENSIATWIAVPLLMAHDEWFVMLVEGLADVNGPAKQAYKRMVARELKIDDQFVHLYEYIRQVASNGFSLNLNKIAMDTDMDKEALHTLRSAEYELTRKAVSALNKFEGVDLFQSDSNTLVDCIAESPRGLPNNDEVRSASHLGVRGDE